jgi:hypothetical protein
MNLPQNHQIPSNNQNVNAYPQPAHDSQPAPEYYGLSSLEHREPDQDNTQLPGYQQQETTYQGTPNYFTGRAIRENFPVVRKGLVIGVIPLFPFLVMGNKTNVERTFILIGALLISLSIAMVGYAFWPDLSIECQATDSDDSLGAYFFWANCVAPILLLSYGVPAILYFIALILVSQMKSTSRPINAIAPVV